MVEYVRALFTVDEETEGQGLVEYALIIFLVSIACIAALTVLGGQINNVFGQITAALEVAEQRNVFTEPRNSAPVVRPGRRSSPTASPPWSTEPITRQLAPTGDSRS